MTPSQAVRLFHTVRHLQPVQVLYRAKYGLLPRARINERVDAPLWPSSRETAPVPFAAGPDEYLGDGCFRFLNQEGQLVDGWNAPHQARLWLYNLHYFNYLNQATREQHARSLAALIDRWIAANPTGAGAGWEPYPLSLRIVNWIKWARSGQWLANHALTSLYVQVRYLAQRLEYHLLGNHLFANAKALICAGLFFDTPEASDWLATGLAILRRELPRQTLDDGGHFELSPMYHAIFVEDLLDIVNLAMSVSTHRRSADAIACLELARKPLPAALAWLRTMTHPDGEIAQFNDAAFGIARNHAALAAYAQRLGIAMAPGTGGRTLTSLETSGYVRVEYGDYVALLDVARIGPDYLPGHAHADTLSFELSLAGRRLIVDAGTSTYAIGGQRMSERGTAAHNTVTYQSQNSSDVWSAFRVGRRAYPVDRDMRVTARHPDSAPAGTPATVTLRDGALHESAAWSVSASHTGYAHLPGRVMHRRSWHGDDHTLVIVDRLERADGRAVTELDRTFATLRFAPHLDVSHGADSEIIVSDDDGVVCRITHSGATAHLIDDFHHPRFGVKLPCKLLRLPFLHATLLTRLSFGNPT
ncbi:heparinase [Paraburkholderia sp. Ac-20336]|uniref:heparinase II/III family protein n=1 Tax=Paraburkholderia sp. Ac-20336 TaxID=2703886 RepID=UPI00197F05CD|nr:alginate lyase family protein [Paraburkholderia sp. Ac-20336]MBN3803865.1 heparinase [Paraburkholderia sp. Ac-20336]